MEKTTLRMKINIKQIAQCPVSWKNLLRKKWTKIKNLSTTSYRHAVKCIKSCEKLPSIALFFILKLSENVSETAYEVNKIN